jgi:hypothetical protein
MLIAQMLIVLIKKVLLAVLARYIRALHLEECAN